MATAPPPARQRFNPRERAAALPSSYTTTRDTTEVSTYIDEFSEQDIQEIAMTINWTPPRT